MEKPNTNNAPTKFYPKEGRKNIISTVELKNLYIDDPYSAPLQMSCSNQWCIPKGYSCQQIPREFHVHDLGGHFGRNIQWQWRVESGG